MHLLPTLSVRWRNGIFAISECHGAIIEDIDDHFDARVERMNVSWFVVERKNLKDDPADPKAIHGPS